MATIKSYTSLPQAEILSKILPFESADMCYPLPCVNNDKPLLENGGFGSTPCWSLATLLDAINKDYYTTLYHDGVAWNIEVIHHDDVKDKHHTYAGTQVDACVEMIIKLHEQKLL